MMCHYLVRRHCTSEAENTIVDKLVLFQKTRGGRIIFPDRSVEWKLKCARQSGLGHFYNKGSKAKFISHNLITCNQHPDFLKPEKSTLKSKRKKIEFNASYLESFHYQIDSNMWHGEPKVVPMKKFVERSKYQPSEEENHPLQATDLESPDEKGCLYADSAFIISNGKKRVCEYFAKVLTDQHNTILLPEALRLLLEWGKANSFQQREKDREQIGLPWSEEDWKLRLDEQISNWYHREDEDCEPLDVRIKEELQDPFFTFTGTNAKISESAQCKFDCSSVSLPVMVDENAEDEPVNQEETQAEEDVSECNSDDLCFDEDFDI